MIEMPRSSFLMSVGQMNILLLFFPSTSEVLEQMYRLLISRVFTPLGGTSVVVENVDIEELDFDLIDEASNPGTPRKFRGLRNTPQKRPRTEG